MYKSILSGAFHGMESFLVQVEADISDGLPCMDMIGYLSSEVKETRERVRVGIKNSGYQLPVKRITINLSPADVRKGGSAFDLPVALALLAASGQMDEAAKMADAARENEEARGTGEYLVLGEMGLTLANALKATVFLTDLNDFAAVNAIYERYFGPDYPARSCVEVSRLPAGARVEVELICEKTEG